MLSLSLLTQHIGQGARIIALLAVAGLAQSCAGGYNPSQMPPLALHTTEAAPIDLVGFHIMPVGDTQLVQWETAIELGSDYFMVERSQDGRTFQSIGSVAGDGMSVTPQPHKFTDQHPLNSTAYYRLRQVDLDGAVHISPVRTAETPNSFAAMQR